MGIVKLNLVMVVPLREVEVSDISEFSKVDYSILKLTFYSKIIIVRFYPLH